MRGQAAFEYMLVVIIVLAFLVPMWAYIIDINNDAGDELTLSYAKNAVEKIVSASDLVYTQGPPAKVRLSVFIPQGIESYNITNRTIILNVVNFAGRTTVFSTSRARLNGTLPAGSGNYWIEVRAIDDADYDVNIGRA
jgi:hypothetical protein